MSATLVESVVPPSGEEQTHTMDVDDDPIDQPPPTSPLSQMEDDLLTGGGAVGGSEKDGDGGTSN